MGGKMLFVAALVLALALALPRLSMGDDRGHGGYSGGDEGRHHGGGHGDPIMTDFFGRSFEFFGKSGQHYNVISELNHQVSMKLKLGQMWDHNGTYIDGMGFQYKDFQVICELDGDDIKVYLDGKRLRMEPDEEEQEHIMAIEQGEMMLLWQLHRPDMGQALQITTDMINMVIYVTPAGTIDEGGTVQPAYLNFDAELLAPPAGGLQGIIGQGYDRMALPTAVADEDDFRFHGEERDYKISGYFPEAHKHNAFAILGKSHSRRRLIERVNVAFPLHFSSKIGSRPAQRRLLEIPVSLHSPLDAAVARSGVGHGRKAI